MENETKYVQGFNHGYALSKYEPGLLAKIVKNVLPSGEYLNGFFSGKEEYEIEKNRTQLNELDNLRNQSKDREHDLEK